MVIADGPIPQRVSIRGYNHFLGESSISFFASKPLASTLNGEFPTFLDQAPMLIPSHTSVVRSRLMKWLDKQHLFPRIVGEFEDSALMKAFGRGGAGIFIAPSAIAQEVEKQYGVKCIGTVNEINDQFYAITMERKISHPAVVAITQKARQWLT